MTRLQSLLALGAMGAIGCAGNLAERDANKYRDDSRALLASKAPAVKSCYDGALKTDAKVSGTVVVSFKVQPETGRIVEARLDDQKTTAPDPLGRCVLQAMQNLKLDPPDTNEGQATFAWEFKPRK
jgi:hypothetical protein